MSPTPPALQRAGAAAACPEQSTPQRPLTCPEPPQAEQSPQQPARPELGRLLRDLGPALRRGSRATTPRAGPGLATGFPAIDRLLGGGLASGRLSELSGPPSSGVTTLCLALLARATAAGETVGLVDDADAFHPASAAAAGVVLERVLWARPPGAPEAMRCCERLLQARGFAAVLLDTGGGEAPWLRLPSGVWQRLARAATATGTALVVLSRQRVTGAFADLALALQPTGARFDGSPSLFEGLEIEAVVTRRRRGPLQGPVALRLHAAPEAGPADPEAGRLAVPGPAAAQPPQASAGP